MWTLGVLPCFLLVICSLVSGQHIKRTYFAVGTKENPGSSCLDIKTRGGTKSQNYFIKLNGQTLRVYCDQTTEGGGWTLVYAFYFQKNNRAVVPRPSWPLYGEVKRSVTIPQSETDFNAMDFMFWTNLGTNFMIKSNTNNWISCSEGTGSLVNWRSGSLKCKIAKRVTKKCLKVLPNAIVVDYYWSGPNIYDDRVKTTFQQVYYNFDTWMRVYPQTIAETGSEPAWADPCGGGRITYHGKPRYGSVYIR